MVRPPTWLRPIGILSEESKLPPPLRQASRRSSPSSTPCWKPSRTRPTPRLRQPTKSPPPLTPKSKTSLKPIRLVTKSQLAMARARRLNELAARETAHPGVASARAKSLHTGMRDHMSSFRLVLGAKNFGHRNEPVLRSSPPCASACVDGLIRHTPFRSSPDTYVPLVPGQTLPLGV